METAPAHSAPYAARKRGLSRLLAAAGICVAGLVSAVPTHADEPSLPAGVGQDEVDLQGRLNIVLGAGARALGMGGAFLARADDATAASWNPAGLSYLLRPEVSLVWAQNRITIDSSAEASHFRGRQIDFAAVTFPIHSIAGAAQLSYQRVVPFAGQRTIQRSQSFSTLDAEGGFDVLALGSGWKVTPTLRVGAALNHWFNGFRQTKVVDRSGAGRLDTTIAASFDFRGWNTNLGVIWSPYENLNIGAVAKTAFVGRVHLVKSREDTFSDTGVRPDPFTTNKLDRDDLRLDFPAAYGVGASWRLRSSLTVSADYTRTAWSKARIHNFYVLSPTVLPAPGTPAELSPPEVFDSLPYPLLTAAQTDAQQIRIGAEYVFIHRRLRFPLRAGYILDRQFFQAQDRHAPVFGALTLGTGVLVGPLLLDFAYVREAGRFTSLDGVRVMQTTHRLFASAIYRIGSLR
jgi:hypothetical protein